MVSSINCGTSVLCGFVVFSLLGHMSDILDLPIKDVAKSGEWVIFVLIFILECLSMIFSLVLLSTRVLPSFEKHLQRFIELGVY